MKKVKYNENNNPSIYVLATPIGNLDEINTRFINTINKVDTILCEDTRVMAKLLNYLKINNKRLISYHEHNEYDKLKEIIELTKKQHEIALVSDAGYPLLSDPGQHLINKAIEEDINIIVINGSNALIPAIINSGFSTIPFTFIGFLSKKNQEAKAQLAKYVSFNHTIVLYESIHRIQRTLKIISELFNDVDVSISREITKLNEEHIYGKVSELLLEQLQLKGELVVCIDNSKTTRNEIIINEESIIEEVNNLVSSGVSKKDAIKITSKKIGVEKNFVYNLVHQK